MIECSYFLFLAWFFRFIDDNDKTKNNSSCSSSGGGSTKTHEINGETGREGEGRGGRISLWKTAHSLLSLSFFSILAWLNIHWEKKMRRTRCSLLIFSEHAKVSLSLLWFYYFSEQLCWHIDLIVQIRYSPLLLSLLKDFIACLSFFPTSAFSFPSPSLSSSSSLCPVRQHRTSNWISKNYSAVV